jgi:hypothetical protein
MMKTEQPTGNLRWLNGKLQQEWAIPAPDGDEGNFRLEWRDVPEVSQ